MFPFQQAAKPAAGSNPALITLNSVRKVYHSIAGSVEGLRGVSFEVTRGEFIAITGKSGSGKTTLVNMLTGLDRLTEGEIWVADTPVHRLGPEKAARWRRQTIGVVFQSFELMPSLSNLQNVTLPMDFAGRGRPGQQRQRGLELLAQVGIAEHAHKKPAAISGGQQQRVSIARAMANNPPLLVADEPTGSLDSATTAAVLDVFAALAAEGTTVLIVTHDADVARRANRVLTLADGQLVR